MAHRPAQIYEFSQAAQKRLKGEGAAIRSRRKGDGTTRCLRLLHTRCHAIKGGILPGNDQPAWEHTVPERVHKAPMGDLEHGLQILYRFGDACPKAYTCYQDAECDEATNVLGHGNSLLMKFILERHLRASSRCPPASSRAMLTRFEASAVRLPISTVG